MTIKTVPLDIFAFLCSFSGFWLLLSGPLSLFSSFSFSSFSSFLLLLSRFLLLLSLQGLFEAMGLSSNCNGDSISGNGEVSIKDGIGEESGVPVDPSKSPEFFGPRFPGESRFAVRVGGATGFR